MSSSSATYPAGTAAVVAGLDREEIERVATGLAKVREGGRRLFLLGVGGSHPAFQLERTRWESVAESARA